MNLISWQCSNWLGDYLRTLDSMFSYRNKTEGLSKVTSANISETVRDSDIVTMDNKQK